MTPEEVDAIVRLAKACAEEACERRNVDSSGYQVSARAERKEREAAEVALHRAASEARRVYAAGGWASKSS